MAAEPQDQHPRVYVHAGSPAKADVLSNSAQAEQEVSDLMLYLSNLHLDSAATDAAANAAQVETLLQAMAAQASTQVNQMTGKALGSAATAAARLRQQAWAPGLLQAIERESLQRLRHALPHRTGNGQAQALSDAAAAGHEPDAASQAAAQGALVEVLQGLVHAGLAPQPEYLSAAAAALQSSELTLQDLAALIWCLSKLSGEVSDKLPALLSVLTHQALRHLRAPTPAASLLQILHIVQGFALLQFDPGPPLVAAAARAAQQHLGTAEPRELVYLLWSFAKLSGQPLLPEVAALAAAAPAALHAQLSHHPAQFKPKMLSSLLWACVKLSITDQTLLEVVRNVVLQHLPQFQAPELGHVIWACAALSHHPGQQFLTQLCNALAASWEQAEDALLPSELAKLMWALAVQTHHPGTSILGLATAQVSKQTSKLSPAELATFLWGAAKFGHKGAAALAEPVISLASSWQPSEYGSQDVSSMLWAFAVVEALQGQLVHALAHLCEALPPSDFKPDALVLLFQAHMALSLPQAAGSAPVLPLTLVQRGEVAWRQTLVDAQPSQACQEVAATLSSIGVQHTVRATIDQGLLAIDVALPAHQIAVQVDGPNAYCSNEPFRPLGGTLLTWRLLRAQSWQVLSVPFYVWDAMTTTARQQAYLTQLLPMSLQEAASATTTLPASFTPPQHMVPVHSGGSLSGLLTSSQTEAATADRSSEGSGPPEGERGSQSRGQLHGGAEAGPSPNPLQWRNPGLEHLAPAEVGSPHLSSSLDEGSGRASPAAFLRGPSSGAQALDAHGRPRSPVRMPGGMGVLPAHSSALALGPNPLDPSQANDDSAELRRYWYMVTRAEPGGPEPHARRAAALPGSEGGVSVSELKRIIELQPLETPAAAAVASRLALLTPPQFSALLSELARDNHAFRAWQLFDWVRVLPDDHDLKRLCDAGAYTAMIALCGTWQQLRRALQLVADMRARSLECGQQAYTALLMAAVKGGETELAVDVYRKMGAEGMAREHSLYATMVDLHVRSGQLREALGVLGDMKEAGLTPEVHLYNLLLVACTKLAQPRSALEVYQRMLADGAQPNTKTFTALIGSVGKMGAVQQAMGIVSELLAADSPANAPATYSALLAACEKGGLWDLAISLFEKMCAEGVQPDVGIFNSMIAACAHGGEFAKARHMFDCMGDHNCKPDAVTFANLIRAYKKGGQWCLALDTFEAMQASGCQPHTAVFSSIIDVLWQTGIGWAQAKALRLFTAAVRTGSLAPALESCKKGVLKVDLQALTVGVAVLSMAAWLSGARDALMHHGQSALDASRKLAIVNGLGEHSRAQGHSAAVKEAVGAALQGCRAPFRLVQDHSRSGRLEAPSLALRAWLFSDHFALYLSLVQVGRDIATSEFLKVEQAEAANCTELFQRIQTWERRHPVLLKVLHERACAYLGMRKAFVSSAIGTAGALGMGQEVVHTAVALMDRVMASGVTMTDLYQNLFVCVCLRLAAVQEGAFLPNPAVVSTLAGVPAGVLERMEANVASILPNDTECISTVHCLKVYVQRLGCDLLNAVAVRRAAGISFNLAMELLGELPALQFPPSLLAAAILYAARKAQGCVPFWPSVLAQLTGFSEAGSAPFVSATAVAERVCERLLASAELPFGYM